MRDMSKRNCQILNTVNVTAGPVAAKCVWERVWWRCERVTRQVYKQVRKIDKKQRNEQK